MKKALTVIGFIVLIAIVVGGRLYKKYDRQKIKEEQLKEQRDWAIEVQRVYKLNEKKRQDSIRNAQPTRMDSIQLEIEKKRKNLQEIMKKLEKEAKEKKE